MTRFDPSLAVRPDGKKWVDAFRSRRENGESFAYQAEHIAPLNIRTVWNAVQQIEYFDDWFTGHGHNRAKSEIPAKYGRGQQTPENRATIIEVSLSEGIIFRQNDAFFILNLIDYGPSATLMRLRCCDYHERKPGILSKSIRAMIAEKDRDQSSDIESTRRRLVQLSNLAEDLKEFGRPADGKLVDGKKLEWITWHASEGIMRVLPDKQGKNQFKVGQKCRSGKVAYVVPDHLANAGYPEGEFIEKWYVQCYHDGKVVDIKRNNGDKVSPGDRLVLIES